MDRNELVNALQHMKPETGSLVCLGCGYEHRCSTHGCAVIRAAIEELEHAAAMEAAGAAYADRLTEEIQIGPFAALKDKSDAKPGAFGTYECFWSHMEAVTRLKFYEDSGLTPQQVLELAYRRKPEEALKEDGK